MGCNCGGQRNVRRAGQRPISGPRQKAIVNGQAARPTPTEIRALNAQNTQTSAAGMTKHRRDVERKRRLIRILLGTKWPSIS